jgi:hypothetical protein
MEVLEATKVSKPRGLSKSSTLASNQQAAKLHYLQTHIYILLKCWTITRGTKIEVKSLLAQILKKTPHFAISHR